MKLKTILEEINKDAEIIQRIRTECSDALERSQDKYGVQLYRGDGTFHGETYYLDPRNRERKSKNTNNIFTTFVKGSGQWEEAGIPLRNKSILFTNQHGVSGYGKVYCVFPINGAKIARGEERDNWENFRAGAQKVFGNDGVDVDAVNVLMKEILRIGVGDLEARECEMGDDYDNLISQLKICDTKLQEIVSNFDGTDYHNSYYHKKIQSILEYGGTIKALHDYVDPQTNNIIQTDILNVEPDMDMRELWTDSPCYFVAIANETLLKELGIWHRYKAKPSWD
jgi:hypothetical protein